MVGMRTWRSVMKMEAMKWLRPARTAPKAAPLDVRAHPMKNPTFRRYPGRWWKVTDSGRSDRCDRTAADLLRARSNRHAPQRTARQEQHCICRLAREIADAKSQEEAEHAGENSRDGGLESNGARQGSMVISAIAAVLIDGAVICYCMNALTCWRESGRVSGTAWPCATRVPAYLQPQGTVTMNGDTGALWTGTRAPWFTTRSRLDALEVDDVDPRATTANSR
jgi:hypothetical protein